MDSHVRQSMFRYYDERAPEYEEAYLLGTGTASIRDPTVFQAEASRLGHIVQLRKKSSCSCDSRRCSMKTASF